MTTEQTELTGKVVNGVVILDQPGRLQDGTKVRIQPVAEHPDEESDI